MLYLLFVTDTKGIRKEYPCRAEKHSDAKEWAEALLSSLPHMFKVAELYETYPYKGDLHGRMIADW